MNKLWATGVFISTVLMVVGFLIAFSVAMFLLSVLFSLVGGA